MQDRPAKTKPTLFTPIAVGPLEVPNRIVMAPLTRSRAAAGNVPTTLNALYYAQRTSAGLIIAEATKVPAALIERFARDGPNEQLLAVLSFLSPLTTRTARGSARREHARPFRPHEMRSAAGRSS